MRHPPCSFNREVHLLSDAPDAYRQFLAAVKPSVRIWSLRARCEWLLLRDGRELLVIPIWATHDEAQACATHWWPEAKPASISISRLVDDWLNGRLDGTARVGIAIESPLQGILVEQHRMWVDLIETVDYLP